jgi:uncharacterized protein YndB with AHSA1/START domain
VSTPARRLRPPDNPREKSEWPTDRELVLTRFIDAPREKAFRAWTDHELLKQWFAPPPYTSPSPSSTSAPAARTMSSFATRRQDSEHRGIYLDVVENERLVFTDAVIKTWQPSEKHFKIAILTFEPEGSGTRYTASVRHGRKKTATPEKLGFHKGWGQCADQRAALVAGV